MSLCLADAGELGFLIDPVGPGTRTLCSLGLGRRSASSARSETGSTSGSRGPLIVGGGIGVAPFPFVAQVLGAPRAILGFRSSHHAEAAALVPGAEVVLEPTFVTALLPDVAG